MYKYVCYWINKSRHILFDLMMNFINLNT